MNKDTSLLNLTHRHCPIQSQLPFAPVKTGSDHASESLITQLEAALVANGKITSYIISPSDVEHFWRHTRVKDEIVKFFQEKYKPKSQYEAEKVEYNQINILAEQVQFNIIFAKNELLFDNIKVAMFLDIFWKLLEFDPDADAKDPDIQNYNSQKTDKKSQDSFVQSPHNIEFRGGEMEVDQEFQAKLKHKLDLLKRMITDQLLEENVALRINQREAERIVKYAQETYFRHLRLYEFVFNNKTASEIKRINFTEEEARNAAPLNQAL